MAVSVIGKAIERGDLAPGGRVLEYIGGSTGMALAAITLRASEVLNRSSSRSGVTAERNTWRMIRR